MWIKLAIVGAICLSLLGAVASFIHAQREIGAANVRAEYAEQQQKRAEDNERLAKKGEQDALKIAAGAVKRRQTAQAALETLKLARNAQSDALALKDPAYAAWRDVVVPESASEQLRIFVAQSAAGGQGAGTVPAAHRLPAAPGVSPDSEPTDESWFARVRRSLSRATER